MKVKPILIAASALLVGGAFVYKEIQKGVDVQSMDKKANPRKDFNQYANGNWMKNNPIPETESRWTSFNVLAERNYDLLHTILLNAANTPNPVEGSIVQKVGDFYRIAMDTAKLEREGFGPVMRDFAAITVIPDGKDAIRYAGEMHRKGLPAFFSFGVGQDIKKNDEYTCYLSQGGLSLPDRDYYLKDDEKSKNFRKEYVIHIANMFKLMGTGADEATKTGEEILALETRFGQSFYVARGKT